MIILLAHTEHNQAAVKALLRAYPDETVYDDWHFDALDTTDSTLILVDIVNDSVLAPTALAKHLLDKGFAATHIDTIQIVISDLKPDRPILGFATELCHEIIRLLPNRTLSIVVPNDMNSPTLLVPPDSSTQNWILYATPSQYWSLSSTQTAHDYQGRIADYRQLLTQPSFQGEWSDFLKKDIYLVHSEDVKAQYKEDDDLAYMPEHPILTVRRS